jgi:hypothetical protein
MIHMIATSANFADRYEERKQQYIKGLNSITTFYKLTPYIIEAVKHVDYFPEHFVDRNDYSINKGNNEFTTIDNFFKSNPNRFDDEDCIIKSTLRYEINSSYFLDYIKANPEYDAYCKTGKDIYGENDTGVHTFLFAMKYKCWKDFLANHFTVNTDKDHPVEAQVALYLHTINTKYVDHLGIDAVPWAHNGRLYKV